MPLGILAQDQEIRKILKTMTIPTMTSNCFLFKTHKWRYRYQYGMDKRRAYCLACAITFCVSVATFIFLVYG